MSDASGTARDQLKAIVQRVERIEAEIKDLNDDKSEIYKEARANGFDVKTIKKVITKRKIDVLEREEQDAMFDTYWDAIHGSGLVHAHARENIEEFDPETGEILETNPRLIKQVVDGMQTEAGRAALIAAVDILIEQEEAEEDPVANVEEGANGAIADASDDPASRADEDSERQHSSTVGFADDCRTGGKEQSDASAAPVGDAAADAHGIPDPNSEKDTAVHGSAGRHSPDRVSPQAETATTGSDGANAGGDDVDGSAVRADTSNTAGGTVSNPPAKPLRPHCLRPDNCGGYGSNHCFSCRKSAKANDEEEAA
jgi:uncharacterized protein (UPF0335 family)